MASEIWSHILSGCPSETDSEVKRKSFRAMGSPQCYALVGDAGGAGGRVEWVFV
jgi:hypothetical protein